MAIEKLKTCKSPGTDQILAEMIQAVDNTLYSDTHTLTNSILECVKIATTVEGIYEGRLKSSWTNLITLSQNFLEVRPLASNALLTTLHPL
jgi:hypothetical protein